MMKYLKKYNESYSIDDIEDLFLPLLDNGAKLKIYDGFFESEKGNRYPNFFQDEKRISDNSYISKLVVIKLKIDMVRIEIEPWKEIQNNSGMYFQSKDNFIKYREVINDIYGCLSHLTCNYNIDLLPNEIRLLLIFDKVNKDDLVSSEKIKNAYVFLFDELIKIGLNIKIFWSYGVIKVLSEDTDYLESILKSLLNFNSNWDNTWNEYDKIPEIIKIVSKIDKMGYTLDISGENSGEYSIKIQKK